MEVDFDNWKVIEAEDKYFFDQLPLCLRDIIQGKKKTHGCEGSNGHDMNIALTNKLFSLKASVETRINAFRKQDDFDYEKAKFFIEDLENRNRSHNRKFISSCKTIDKRGFCNPNCPYTYRIKKNLPKRNKKERNGLTGGFDELNTMFAEDMEKPQDKQFCEKTTRSGTTTSIIKTAIEKNKRILVIAPTIDIFQITVQEAIALTDKQPKLFRIGSNSDLCFQVRQKTEDYAILKEFPFMLKGTCKYCNFADLKKEGEYVCKWRIAVNKIESYDLIYITTAKIFYMLKSNDPEVKELLDTIFNLVDIIFLDEISSVLNVGEEGFTFQTISDKLYNKLSPEIDFYQQFQNDFEAMGDYLINSFTNNELLIWDALIFLIEDIKKKNKIYIKSRQNSFIRIKSSVFTMIEELDTKFKTQKEKKSGVGTLLNIYKKIQKYAEATDIYPKHIVKLLMFSLNDYFYIQYTNPEGYDIRAELIPGKPIREFLEKLNYISERKKFYCTDATAPLLKIDKMFPNITKLIINDPNNTASIQKVHAFDKQINLSRAGFVRSKLPEIIAYCKNHGNSNTMIICQSKNIARELRKQLVKGETYHELTYFRSGLTIGTPSDCRTIINIG